MRPYVPVVDNILATLQSLADLALLIICLPWEYVVHWWHRWSWRRIWIKVHDNSPSRDRSPPEDNAEGRRRLRPRTESHQAWIREADRQTQAVLKEIDNAQDRVRTRTRSQLPRRNPVRAQPVRETRQANPNSVGLRMRKRVLENSNGLPDEMAELPGSRSTGIHHLDPTTISQLAQTPPQHSPIHHHAPVMQSVPRPTSPMRVPTPSSSQSSHEIWYPPQSAFEGLENHWMPPNTTYRTPSPIYPPLPSAYRFTPRRSDPLPPRTTTPPDLVRPTPRRVSTDATMSHTAFDAYEGIDQFPGRSGQVQAHASPSTRASPAESSSIHVRRPHGKHRHAMGPEGSFQEALEPSIQAMDVDTETLSTRDGSSANEQSMEDEGGIKLELRNLMTEALATDIGEARGSVREHASGTSRDKRKTPVRRSARVRAGGDRPSSIETDEFGFTIRQAASAPKGDVTVNSSSLSSLGTHSVGPAAGPATSLSKPKLKPLARTKPALKATQEEGPVTESSDEENIRKKRKLKQDVGDPDRLRTLAKNKQDVIQTKSGKTRRKAANKESTQTADSPDVMLKNPQVGTRVARASTGRQPLSRQGRGTVAKRGRGT